MFKIVNGEEVALTGAEIDAREVEEAAARQAQCLASMVAELATFRANRELYLNRLVGIGMAAQFEDRADDLAAVMKVRKGLLALASLPSVTGAATLDELKAAMKQAYASLLVGVSAEVKAAFKGVDA